MPTRSGSVIIYILGLTTVLVILAYAFLRSTMNDSVAGDASQKVLLAQSAARMGTMRAVESIVTDYARSSMSLNGRGTTTTVSGVTFLDGHWRAPFVSLLRPNQIYVVDHNHPQEFDDVTAENFVLHPLVLWSSGDEATRRHAWHDRMGSMSYDGRGRYLEAGYLPVSPLPPAGEASQPTAILRFTDRTAPAPERAEGLFLDRNFHRIDTGNPTTDRIRARFRLRHAVGVEDLGGHLLSNPHADGDFRIDQPGASYRQPPAYVLASQHAWYNMALGMSDDGLTSALRMEHIFLGRGNTSNVDRQPSNGGPVTFPYMFRQHQPSGPSATYWGFFAHSPSGPIIETDGLYTYASLSGGEAIPAMTNPGSYPFVAHGFGPQISWYNQHYAAIGCFGGQSNDDNGSIGNEEAQFIPTPYGRRLQIGTGAPENWRWYEGRVDTPWYVNLLTATPRTIHCMLLAYLPPKVKNVRLQMEHFIAYTGVDPSRGHDTWNSTPMASNPANPGTPVQMRGRDLFTSLSSPAFSYLPPSADGIIPNFQRPDQRSAEARYPGRLWNSTDDLGKDIDLDVDPKMPIGRCTHVGLPFFFGLSANGTFIKGDFPIGTPPWTTQPPPGWGEPRPVNGVPGYDGSKDLVRVLPLGSTQAYTYEHSYWWDLVRAFTTAISTARAAWVQYPTTAINPYTGMDTALHDPAAFDSLEEIDRLFLRQLGEDFDAPGNGIPLAQVDLTNPNGATYRLGAPPAHTIRTLQTNSLISIEAANVMERVLNDMRMSFFGAGPQYSETFRPKDFSGDLQVHCSAYDQNPLATDADVEDGIAWWAPADGSGNGPPPRHWFSLSGCFYLGHSHYFRIFSRGAVWDNLTQATAMDQMLETVLSVDPEGSDPSDVRILYQRWHYDRSITHLSRQAD